MNNNNNLVPKRRLKVKRNLDLPSNNVEILEDIQINKDIIKTNSGFEDDIKIELNKLISLSLQIYLIGYHLNEIHERIGYNFKHDIESKFGIVKEVFYIDEQGNYLDDRLHLKATVTDFINDEIKNELIESGNLNGTLYIMMKEALHINTNSFIKELNLEQIKLIDKDLSNNYELLIEYMYAVDVLLDMLISKNFNSKDFKDIEEDINNIDAISVLNDIEFCLNFIFDVINDSIDTLINKLNDN